LIEKEILTQSTYKPLVWKRFIDDVFLLWNITKDEVDDFIVLANKFHPTINFTVEISEKEITFLDTNVYKGQRFHKGVTKGYVKEEALRLLRANSSKTTFEANIKHCIVSLDI